MQEASLTSCMEAVNRTLKIDPGSLAIIQNKCLRRISGAYKATPIAELETETHILPIDIHLDELQAKARQRLQSSGHYERIEKIKRKIHRTLKEERDRHRKAELTPRLRKKA